MKVVLDDRLRAGAQRPAGRGPTRTRFVERAIASLAAAAAELPGDRRAQPRTAAQRHGRASSRSRRARSRQTQRRGRARRRRAHRPAVRRRAHPRRGLQPGGARRLRHQARLGRRPRPGGRVRRPRRRGRASTPRSSRPRSGITQPRRLPRRRHDELARGEARRPSSVERIDVAALHERLGRRAGPRRARAAASGTTGHIPGSVHAPYHDIDGIPDGLDPARPIAVICSSGQRSARRRVAAAARTARAHVDPRRRRRRRHLERQRLADRARRARGRR